MTTTVTARLRTVLTDDEVTIIPGVVNPWAARLAQRAGHRALLATGAGIANTQFGLPDLGLIGLREMAEAVDQIAGSVQIPVIADGDTGYGNALNVVQTVRRHEAAGAAGVVIEDQRMPKKCGHFAEKRLVPVEEMIEKIVAAIEARTDPDLVLIARTDAIAVGGFDEAIARGRAYAGAGADVVFVEAPRDLDELAAVPGLVEAPTIANIVEGGLTPHVGADELQEMGYAGVLFANMAMRVAGHAMADAFEVLRTTGSSKSLVPEMLTWGDRQAIAGLDEWSALEERVVSLAREARGATDASV